MYRKLHTTGTSKLPLRALALLMALISVLSVPFSAFAEETPAPEYTISVSGFALDFNVDTDYYIIHPESFENCSINSYTGFTNLTVGVEQYAGYFPYKNTPYVLKEPLKLGHGRSKITLTATLADNTTREYLLCMTDPNASDYAYAKAKIKTDSLVKMYAHPDANSSVLETFEDGERVYYLKTEGDWHLVEQLYTGVVGYIYKDFVQWEWLETEMPEIYAEPIAALQSAHPNWSFTFVDVEQTYADALAWEQATYGATNEDHLNPLNYLNEKDIFAFLDINTYDPSFWTSEGISAIWYNEPTLKKYPELVDQIITKADAVRYIQDASRSLWMNPYIIASRAAHESGYGSSPFARGAIENYEGYYNFFGIKCYTNNPTIGAEYAKKRNWNSVYRSFVEGANWIKDGYVDRGRSTIYFFRYARFEGGVYMDTPSAPKTEAQILARAFTDPNAKAHFIVPVYRDFKNPFTDVRTTDYFHEPVLWAVEKQITTGKDKTTFAPADPCSRAQIVTFLWRAAGSPEPQGAELPFTDVAADSYYEKAVRWAVENGITTGMTDTTFEPGTTCTRGQIVTFLWRAKGAAEVTAENPFTDVAAEAYYTKAVLWAVENRITNGKDATTFAPADPCSRAQIVTFLYRAYQ